MIPSSSLEDMFFRHVPPYHDGLYKEGYNQAEVWYAFRKMMRERLEEQGYFGNNEAEPVDMKISIKSEVKGKK